MNPLVWSTVMLRADAARALDPFTRPDLLYAEDFDLYHRVQPLGRAQNEQPGLLDLDARAGDHLLHVGEVRQPLLQGAGVEFNRIAGPSTFNVAAGLGSAGAQQQGQPSSSTSAATSAAKAARPLWSELSPKQQAVLAPIAAEWDNLDTVRRKKWVTIANRYPKMQPDEQMRLQNRMQAWAGQSARLARAEPAGALLQSLWDDAQRFLSGA